MLSRSSSWNACGAGIQRFKSSSVVHSAIQLEIEPDQCCDQSSDRSFEDMDSPVVKLKKSKSSRCSTRGSTKSEDRDPLSEILGCKKTVLTIAEKLEWLRVQVIGDKIGFSTPFGKRQLLYADHTASGRALLFVENFILHNVLPFYGNTHTDDSFIGKTISAMVHKSAKYIKKQLGGTSNDALLFCGSGCTAALKRLQEVMGIAVPSTLRSRILERLKVEERWVVFTGPYEHHSNLLSWRQSLAEVVEIPLNEDGFIDMAVLEETLESPTYTNRLKIGSFSACSNVTGLITDTRAIARLLHKHGAFACFDFAASAPHVEINMRSSEKDGYDALVLSPHKFAGGPGTPGILMMRKSLYLLGRGPPSTCGGGTVAYVNGFSEKDTLYHKNIEEREDGGTPPIVQKIRAALAFWVKDFVGTTLIEQRESFFIMKAIKRLSKNPNIQVLGNTKANRAPILSFLVKTREKAEGSREDCLEKQPWTFGRSKERNGGARIEGKPLHGRFVVRLLNDLFGIQARGGCACAGPYGHSLLGVAREQSLALRNLIKKGYEGLKPGWARLSFSYDMTDEEVEFVLAAIELVAKYGQRFLPLYEFHWQTGDWRFNPSTNIVKEISPLLRSSPHQQLHSSPSNDELDGHDQGVQFRTFSHCLRLAKAIARAMPKFPQPRPIPIEITDARLVLFCV